ncbi:hypothetical protein [Morganella morganii]|uniref:hypothetical protein n=1 Tax=Morganella morganii TaxID=582 RepID=UPI0034E3972D
MTMETIEVKVIDEQPVKFQGRLVARTDNNVIELYETQKGHWVVVHRLYTMKRQGGREIRIFSGYAREMKIIENKDIDLLSKHIGYCADLEQLCQDLGIEYAKKLDL